MYYTLIYNYINTKYRKYTLSSDFEYRAKAGYLIRLKMIRISHSENRVEFLQLILIQLHM